MEPTPDSIKCLLKVPSDMEAALIVNVLRDHEVTANAVGGFTAGFRAEAPGDVQVYVKAADFELARKILCEYEKRR